MSVQWATRNKLRVAQTDTTFIVIFKGDDGVVEDISTQTLLQIKFQDPTGAISTETGSFTTDGTDGKAQYKDTLPAYSATVGTWKYWGKVTIGTEGPFMSSPLSYDVFAEGEE